MVSATSVKKIKTVDWYSLELPAETEFCKAPTAENSVLIE
jgi:hypothetical protein